MKKFITGILFGAIAGAGKIDHTRGTPSISIPKKEDKRKLISCIRHSQIKWWPPYIFE